MTIEIHQATLNDVKHIVPMFDAYRVFYGQQSDVSLAETFLTERITQKQSIIFVAIDPAVSYVGFTQLFPSFSSARACRTYILNDLFVIPSARRKGVARLLLEEAAQFGRSMGAARLSLATALDNLVAQKLYESIGWKRDEVFCYYNLSL